MGETEHRFNIRDREEFLRAVQEQPNNGLTPDSEGDSFAKGLVKTGFLELADKDFHKSEGQTCRYNHYILSPEGEKLLEVADIKEMMEIGKEQG